MINPPNPTPAATPTREMTIRVTDATLLALFESKEVLGFHTENALAALVVQTFSGVPAEKIFEVLAKVRSYHRAPRKGKK